MKEPIFIKEFLPIQLLNFMNSYCILKFSNKKEFEMDTQAHTLVKDYADYAMETLMDLSTPVIEKNVGKKLFPTYSYFRIYDKGSDLKVHTDRDACEYTVALCIGSDPIEKPYEIFIGEEDENSDYKYFNNDNVYTKYKINYKFPMVPNNALIFDGLVNFHWRELCTHDHYMTVFLHYVDQEGPYKEEKYDTREMLGAQK